VQSRVFDSVNHYLLFAFGVKHSTLSLVTLGLFVDHTCIALPLLSNTHSLSNHALFCQPFLALSLSPNTHSSFILYITLPCFASEGCSAGSITHAVATTPLLSNTHSLFLHSLHYLTLPYSEGYSAGSIAQAVATTLPPRRVQKLQETARALDTGEFLATLSKTAYTYVVRLFFCDVHLSSLLKLLLR
jgi:hypothetical protein